MTSRAWRPFSLTVPPEILRLGDEGADVVFRGVGVERDFRPFEHAQKFVFAPEQALQQTVERGVAGSAFEDAVELQAQEARLFWARGALVLLQRPIEPPDRAPHDPDGVALLVVGGNELMDEALGVDPTERVIAEAELAGVVGDDDGLSEQAFGLDRPHKRRFARRPHRIGRHS